MRKRRAGQLYRRLAFLVLCALLAAACGPTQVPPTPVPTPMPFPAPRLLSYSPEPGEEQSLDGDISLVFDQPMDRPSVEAAFAITPTATGRFSWSDVRTAVFAIDSNLQRGARYQVTIADSARNAEGKPMLEPATFTFQTVGFLRVTEVQPAPGADEIAPEVAVTVVFNRPVVPMTAIGSQGDLPQPLTFVPPVRGQGEWLNTSIYTFRPEEGFLPATEYKARIAAGLTDTTGGILPEDFTWTFRTIRPAVWSFSPPEGFLHVGPQEVISVTFNQPMNHASVEEHFLLVAADDVVPGDFRWSGGRTAVDPETMAFIPSRPLSRGTDHTVRVSAGALARTGGVGLTSDTIWSFRTAREPGILSTAPEDGQTDWPVYGSVNIRFASPMDTETFTTYLTIEPPVTDLYVYWYEDDTQADIYFEKEPATAYTFAIAAEAPDRFGAPLGKGARIRFTTGDLDPYAELNTGGRLGAVSAYTDTVVYIAHRNVSRLDLRLSRMSAEAFMRLNGFGDWDEWYNYVPAKDNLVREWSYETSGLRNQIEQTRLELTDPEGTPLPPGLYYLELTAPEVRQRYPEQQPSRFMFVRSRTSLLLKQSASEVVVWATDLASGQPVPGLPLSLYQKAGAGQPAGTTDEKGILFREMETENLWEPFFAVAGQPGEDSFSIAINQWSDGINPWDFGIESEYWTSRYVGHVYTDRPIYRPGQTVYFKGILRADDDAHYTLPQGIGALQVRISDSQGKTLLDQELPLNDLGSLHGELLLDEEAELGTYYIEIQDAELGLYAGTTFLVAEYRKPEFQVQVTTDRDAYLSGDQIQVNVDATYYFGGPVAQADLHWSVLSDDYSFTYRCPLGQPCPWYSWTDFEWGGYEEEYYAGYGQLITEGDTRTDARGQATFSVPAEIAGERNSQRFTIEASVTDINDQQVSSRTATIVHKGEFYIGLAPRRYLSQVGKEQIIDLLTVDWDSQPVAGIPLTVMLMEHRWYSVRRADESGNYYWEWTAEDTPVLTATVTTGGDGKATASFTPSTAGTYRVRASARDRQENEIRSSTYFWVWGGGYVTWRQESNNRIELIADKQQYQVGDVAEILVPSPYSGTVQALVTIERGGIMQSEVRPLRSNSEVLHVPITEDYVPNVFVSVAIVQGSEAAADRLSTFKMGLIKLPVSLASKELKITLTPDRDMQRGEHYGPREKAVYDILTTDYQGNPVEAELSLRLADLAVLALADEPGPTLLERFWRSRGLGVKTSTPLVVALEQYNRELKPGFKGGGGREAEEGGLVRTEFPDTAFWDPMVRTDKEGKARVQVQLPDSLTTWRMQAQGITAETLVGRVDVDVLSTLDLLLRPVLPRFFVVGDKAEIGTVVHNNSAQPLDVQVDLRVDGLVLDGAASRTVQVPAGDKVRVAWPVSVQPVDQVRVRMSARSADLFDAREDTLPVYRYSTPEVVATAGRLSEPEQRQEIVQLPPVLDPTQGELTVQVDGSLTAATGDALSYLEHYPYECVEQTVSRFLPNVLTYQALQELGLAKPDMQQKLSQMVGVALQRLYAEQHYDGGWGWWISDQSNPYLTAYVLQALLEAQRADFVVDLQVMSKAAAYLRDNLPAVSRLKETWEANRLAYMLYVLAEYSSRFAEQSSDGHLGLAIRLFEARDRLDRYAQATLAMALGLLEPDEPARVTTLLSNLAGDAVLSATGTHWEEDEPDYWNMNTDIRTTAIVLWAMSRLDPDSDLLPNVVRWLMAMRKEGHWETTQDTAWSLLGLLAYMRASGELQGDFSYAVYLNGQLLASRDIDKANITESQKLQVEIAQLLRDEANRLVIERQPPREGQSGSGQLYYSAYLRYFLPVEQVKALDRGIIVARRYSPADDPGRYVDSAAVGDVVQVKLTIVAPNDLYYVVIEDPLPAGCEAVDLGLKTTTVVGERPQLRNLTAEEENLWYRRYGWGWWWFSRTEIRDEKVVLFATYLPRGTYEYTYAMRASVPGEFLVVPAHAYQMYFPEVFGRSDGAKFTVTTGQ